MLWTNVTPEIRKSKQYCMQCIIDTANIWLQWLVVCSTFSVCASWQIF